MKNVISKLISWSVLLLLLLPVNLMAQDEETSNFSYGADLVSRYVWRGLNLGGSSPHVQPYVEYSFGETGLAAGFWGSHATGNSSTGAEADFYISYSPIDMISIGVTDYFFPSDQAFARTDRYFNYDEETTGHTIEGMVSFNGTEDIPVSLVFAMNVYGADGVDKDGNNYLAKYLELGYTGTIAETEISPFVGMALDDPAEEDGAVGWYGDSFGVINVGMTVSRAIKISDVYELPISSSVIFNPEAENIYLVFGVSF